MRFRLTHHFESTPEALWAITDDEAFERRLGEASKTQRVTVADDLIDGERVLRRRITVDRKIPRPMQRAIGSDAITYDQITRRRPGENVLHWSIEPVVLRGRFTGRGTTRVIVTGDGCDRVIEGELTIRVPLLGPKMERRLVDDVSASYERAAELIRETLRSR